MEFGTGTLRRLGGMMITLLALAAAAPAARADALADAVAALPPAVEDVRVGGLWSDGDQSGTYRVIVTRTGNHAVAARLFIQWIVDDGESGKLDRSIEITELGELEIDITNVSAEPGDDGLALFIDTLSASGEEQLYELFVRSPEEYRFGPASN